MPSRAANISLERAARRGKCGSSSTALPARGRTSVEDVRILVRTTKILTRWLAAKLFIMWWPGTGLNRRRRPFQGRALPLSYLASVQTSLQFPVRGPAGKPGQVGCPRTVRCNNSPSISTPLAGAKPSRARPFPRGSPAERSWKLRFFVLRSLATSYTG